MTAEEKEVRQYCLQRPLQRPLTNWGSALCQVAVYVSVSVITFLLLRYITRFLKWDLMESPTSIAWILLLIVLLDGRRIGVLLVRLYQHYASESMRRRCVCKPTCSEYALLALDKYCWPRALYKILYRLRYGCQGHYHIDYP